MIETRAASLVYDDHGRQVFACDSIDLRVEDGEFLGILGPSGSGKSSLLYLLCGLKTPSSGDVSYRGRALESMTEDERADLRLHRFGFVFQYPYLLGYLSALENVVVARPDGRSPVAAGFEAPLAARRPAADADPRRAASRADGTSQPAPTEDVEASARELLDKLGLGDKAHRLPHELSGGEKQRVCIARALFGGREVLFADEPTANLDHANGAAVVETLVANRGQGSLVMVTHDPSMLEKADRIVHIMDGRIVDSG